MRDTVESLVYFPFRYPAITKRCQFGDPEKDEYIPNGLVLLTGSEVQENETWQFCSKKSQ